MWVGSDGTIIGVAPVMAIFTDLPIGPGGGPSSFRNVTRAVRTAWAMRTNMKNGTRFTDVGYQLSKHAGRSINSVKWKSLLNSGKINPANWDQAGRKAFRQIWRSEGQWKNTGQFWEKRLSDGRGIKFQHDWKFKGFVD
jgi:hypothetical protein